MPPHRTQIPQCLLSKPAADTATVTAELLAADRAKAVAALTQLRHALSLKSTTTVTTKSRVAK